MMTRHLEVKACFQRMDQLRRRQFVDAHGAVALHVTVPAHRRQPCPGPPDIAAQQLHVDDFLHGHHRVCVLGHTHRPAHDHPLGTAVHPRSEFDVLKTQAGLLDDVLPRRGIHLRQVAVEARGVFGNECTVEYRLAVVFQGITLPFQQELGDAAKSRHVATQGRTKVRRRGGFRSVGEHFQWMLRVLEAFQPALFQRVETNHLGAAFHRLAQRLKHARVVGSGILPDDENRIGLFQVIKGHRPLADADAVAHAQAARFMAHVRAIGKVVGAVGTNKQLIQIGRFVTGPARGIELGLIRRFQLFEVLGDQGKGIVPTGFDITIQRSVVAHRVRQTPLVFKPVVTLRRQRRHGVLIEKRRVDQAPGGFPVDRFGTVLAKLDQAAFLRLAPCTTRAVETAILVGLEHRADVLERVFTAQPVFRHRNQRAPTCGRPLVRFITLNFAHGTSLRLHA